MLETNVQNGWTSLLSRALTPVIAATWIGTSPAAAVEGTIAGKVLAAGSGQPLPNVTLEAVSLTADRKFRVVTDATGSYVVPAAPPGIYAFTLHGDGVSYPVREKLDVRVPVAFLLESCFVLDAAGGAASVSEECTTKLVEPTRVATVGPHRFLLPEQAPTVADLGDPTTSIDHDGIECLTREHFPLVEADIRPGSSVQVSRVYFRSDKHPDFYYVEMTGAHPNVDDFQAILPKPGAETDRLIYYVESVEPDFDTVRTLEFDARVLETADCRELGGAAWFTGEPSIVVGSTMPGAAAIPPGFQAAGITGFVSSLGVVTSVGAATGLGGSVLASTTGILLISGGAAATAGAAVFWNDGEKEASPP